jgi:hypothetical protein
MAGMEAAVEVKKLMRGFGGGRRDELEQRMTGYGMPSVG